MSDQEIRADWCGTPLLETHDVYVKDKGKYWRTSPGSDERTYLTTEVWYRMIGEEPPDGDDDTATPNG